MEPSVAFASPTTRQRPALPVQAQGRRATTYARSAGGQVQQQFGGVLAPKGSLVRDGAATHAGCDRSPAPLPTDAGSAGTPSSVPRMPAHQATAPRCTPTSAAQNARNASQSPHLVPRTRADRGASSKYAATAFWICVRAWFKRDLTVPIGMPSTRAISS